MFYFWETSNTKFATNRYAGTKYERDRAFSDFRLLHLQKTQAKKKEALASTLSGKPSLI